MRWNSFFGGLLFAAAAATAYFPWALAARPLLGSNLTLVSYLTVTVALYLMGSCGSWRQGVRIGLLAGGVGAAVVVLSPSLNLTLFALAVILAIGRSVLAYRAKVGRALVIELGLGAVGLGLAGFLFGGTMVSLGLAIWGFYLVQSFFFLLGTRRERQAQSSGRDPFETAQARAIAIMEEAGG